MKQIIISLLLLGFVGGFAFGADNDSQTVTCIVGEIFEVVLSDGSDFSMTINAATPGLQPTAATPDTSQYLHYTSLVDTATSHHITVTGSGENAPTGTTLSVTAAIGSAGGGDQGTTGGKILIADDSGFTGGDLITSIGTCYTGTGGTDGANLTYEFEVDDPATIVTDAGKDVVVTYTMVDG
ncbi:MAG: hypothetical protein JW969_08870 [Spirochaetales bacterium]|nr:hypothetical protein [Spirochaetales bacterium]